MFLILDEITLQRGYELDFCKTVNARFMIISVLVLQSKKSWGMLGVVVWTSLCLQVTILVWHEGEKFRKISVVLLSEILYCRTFFRESDSCLKIITFAGFFGNRDRVQPWCICKVFGCLGHCDITTRFRIISSIILIITIITIITSNIIKILTIFAIIAIIISSSPYSPCYCWPTCP